MDYLSHWQLRERPFENNRDGAFFYPGREHVEALERLVYLVRDGNMHFGLLTGEIGAGKTMVLNRLQERLEAGEEYAVVHLPNGNLEIREILCELIHHLERTHGRAARRGDLFGQSLYELRGRFHDLLRDKITRLGRMLVVMIDEAQQLSTETLTELKNLTNLGAYDRNSISIILAGQPELSENIRALPPIDQRVGLRFHLPCLNREAVGEYLEYRLQAAGGSRNVFSDETRDTVYEFTRGTPREINRVCKLALDRSYTLGQDSVSAAVVRSIVTDVFQQDALSR